MFTPSSIAAIQLLCCVVDYRTRERTFRVDPEPITTTNTNPAGYTTRGTGKRLPGLPLMFSLELIKL